MHFFNVFLTVLGFPCCMWAFSSCSEQRLLQLQCAGFSLRQFILLQHICSCACRLQQFLCADTVTVVLGLCCPRHVEYSQMGILAGLTALARGLLTTGPPAPGILTAMFFSSYFTIFFSVQMHYSFLASIFISILLSVLP